MLFLTSNSTGLPPGSLLILVQKDHARFHKKSLDTVRFPVRIPVSLRKVE